MQYLNQERIETLSDETFRRQQPYPWGSISDVLTQDGFERLRATLREVELFDRKVGVKRGHGQPLHDRYILHYRHGMELPEAWKKFVAELHGKAYQSFLRRMLGPRKFILTL